MSPLAAIAAFLAGVLIFFAPCTLPIIPAYIGFIAGVAERDIGAGLSGRSRRKVLATSLLFVAGFSIVFVAFGFLAGFAGSWFGDLREVLLRVGGAFILLVGLVTIGLFNPNWIMRERRMKATWVDMQKPYAGFILGASFAFGWTPCIGPILSTILFFASSTETALAGGILLSVFSLGFATPFLLVALMLSRATSLVRRIEPMLSVISRIGGIVLMVIGASLLFGIHSLFRMDSSGLLNTEKYESLLLEYL